MTKYYKIDSNSLNGNLNVSLDIFNKITNECILKIKQNKDLKTKDFQLSKPINTSISKENKLTITINLILNKNLNINELCLLIQKEVSKKINSIIETIPFRISVNIDKLI